jgi:phage terminase large subunit-like protein
LIFARERLRYRDQLIRELFETVHGSWEPLPHQVPPPGEPGIDWLVWLMCGGRGAGKTDSAAHYMNGHAMGPPCIAGPVPHRMAIIAPTLGDASESCVNGPSGLRAHNPECVEMTRKGGSFVIWPNGAQAKLFGAYTKEDPERCRAGGNRCLVWMEEVAAWRYLRTCWEHINLGLLRLGKHPHAVASTTPRNRPTIQALIALAESTGSLTRAPTSANPHLPEHRRAALYRDYGGTRLGLQELEGEMIEDVVGALWNLELIEEHRVMVEDAPVERSRLVIAVDPSWGTTNDEVGIVAGYVGPDRHVYVLEDLSGRMAPSVWGAKVAEAYERLAADKVIAEGNFQGEQVRLVMRVAQGETGVAVNFDLVHASRGKVLRAEPVVALYEQGRVHHVGRLAGLEHQMCHWVPPRNSGGGGRDAGDPSDAPEPGVDGDETPSEYSPDRVDALVFLVTELLLGLSGPATVGVAGGEISRGRGERQPGVVLSGYQRRLHERTMRR